MKFVTEFFRTVKILNTHITVFNDTYFPPFQATYHCLTCILNLCTLCKESHERQKSTTKHIIKNIIELRKIRKEQGVHFIDNTKF